MSTTMIVRRRRRRQSEYNPNLSIPGLSTIVDSREPVLMRILFAVALFMCTYICVIQTYERVNYYFTYPVTLEYEIKQLDVIKFPKVTLCSYFPDNDTDKYAPLDGQDETHDHHSLVNILHNCTYDITKSCLTFWTPTVTTSGRCYTLHLANNVEYIGATSAIRLELYPFPAHDRVQDQPNTEHSYKCVSPLFPKILVHEHREQAVYGVEMDGHELFQGTTTGLYYTHKRYVYKNLPNRPCYSKQKVASCILKCYDDYLYSLNNCSFPYISTMDGIVPFCEFIDADTHSLNIRKVRSSAWQCEYCKRPCVEDNFEVQCDTRDEKDSRNETLIYVMPTREELEILKEVEAYVLYALVCDIGGILGLYLGVCILTLIEIIDFFVQRTLHRNRTSGKPFVRR